MRKAYRIVGSSFEKPTNLPEGFEVRERLVGEVFSTDSLVFHEVKDGSVVVYRQGVANSNVKLTPEEVEAVARFLLKVRMDYGAISVMKKYSRCPGTPHRGHASSDWSCPLDRA